MPKLKVGDKVRYTVCSKESGDWQNVELTHWDENFKQWTGFDLKNGEGAFSEKDLEPLSESVKALDIQVEAENNGGATGYYDFPSGFRTLNDLIEYKNMPFWLGNIFKACYRFGEKDAATKEYDLNKMIYFAGRGLGVLKKEKESDLL